MSFLGEEVVFLMSVLGEEEALPVGWVVVLVIESLGGFWGSSVVLLTVALEGGRGLSVVE